jgi:hypothetical protein
VQRARAERARQRRTRASAHAHAHTHRNALRCAALARCRARARASSSSARAPRRAPVVHGDDVLLELQVLRHQRLVDVDLAKLVFDDRNLLAVVALQNVVHERRLARAQEARHDRHGSLVRVARLVLARHGGWLAATQAAGGEERCCFVVSPGVMTWQ